MSAEPEGDCPPGPSGSFCRAAKRVEDDENVILAMLAAALGVTVGTIRNAFDVLIEFADDPTGFIFERLTGYIVALIAFGINWTLEQLRSIAWLFIDIIDQSVFGPIRTPLEAGLRGVSATIAWYEGVLLAAVDGAGPLAPFFLAGLWIISAVAVVFLVFLIVRFVEDAIPGAWSITGGMRVIADRSFAFVRDVGRAIFRVIPGVGGGSS